MLNKAAILEAAGAAFVAGDSAKSISILTQAIEHSPGHGPFMTALAITHQKAADHEAAIAVLDKQLKDNGADIKSWVLKGVSHDAQLQTKLALQAYQNAVDFAARESRLSPPLSRDVEKAQGRIVALMQRLEDKTYDAFNKLNLSRGSDDGRFVEALDILFGRREIFYQEPHQFYFPGLPQKQFYYPQSFEWAANLEGQYEAIRTEAEQLMERLELFAPYLQSDESSRPDNEHVKMLDNPDWSAFYLIKDGRPVPENLALCPITSAALESIDLCRTNGGTPSVLFSLLKPGAHIPPHSGMLNTRLICHLPLIIPPNCGLRVGNETIQWEAGKLVVFDDSINHEAWNKSDQHRLILLFDIWRPELSFRERELVTKLLDITNA